MAQPGSGKLRFTNANSDYWDVTLPVRPYIARVSMAIDGHWLSNGTYKAYDHDTGGAYDIYSCECVCELNAAETGYLEGMLGTVGTSYGRAQNLTMEMASDSGFHPFGPQESNIGALTVSVSGQHSGRLPTPMGYYKTTLNIVKTSAAFPAYSYGASDDDGDFTIGTVTGCRYPINWCNPSIVYGFTNTILQDGDAEYVDRGTGADAFRTSLVLVQSENKMAEIADYLIGTARAANFTIETPAGMNPFGHSKTDGTYTVRLAQSDLEFTHMAPNQWQLTIDLSYISGPT